MVAKNSSDLKCLNCQRAIEVSDKFCSKCGQENRSLKISFWELLTEFLSSNFNFDTKLGRTLVDLLFKPGEITKQFNSGKRVRYVKPLQMYLFVSFIYFLLVGLDPPSFVNTTPPSEEELTALNESKMVDINVDGTELESVSAMFQNANPDNDTEIDSILLKMGEQNITPWKRHLAKQAIRSMNSDNEEALTQEIYANLSVAMLILLPIFAVLLWFFTRKRSPFYMDSLVFSIHFHSVVLFIFSINMVAALVFNEATVFKIALGLIFVYLTLSIRRVFELSWGKATGNAIGLSLSYSVIFGLSYLAILLLSFWAY